MAYHLATPRSTWPTFPPPPEPGTPLTPQRLTLTPAHCKALLLGARAKPSQASRVQGLPSATHPAGHGAAGEPCCGLDLGGEASRQEAPEGPGSAGSGEGRAGQPRTAQQRRERRGRGGLATGVNIGQESSLQLVPQPSISLPRTGYLGNLCSLIITLQRVPLILPEESASCQTRRVLVDSLRCPLPLPLRVPLASQRPSSLSLLCPPRPLTSSLFFASPAWGWSEQAERSQQLPAGRRALWVLTKQLGGALHR